MQMGIMSHTLRVYACPHCTADTSAHVHCFPACFEICGRGTWVSARDRERCWKSPGFGLGSQVPWRNFAKMTSCSGSWCHQLSACEWIWCDHNPAVRRWWLVDGWLVLVFLAVSGTRCKYERSLHHFAMFVDCLLRSFVV